MAEPISTPGAAGSQPPASGASPTPSSTPSPSPSSATPDVLQYIPEEHRSNPKAYFDQVQADQEWAKYGRGMQPFHKQFQSMQQEYPAFEAWKRTQHVQTNVQPVPSRQLSQPMPAEDEDEDLDYGDPEAVRKTMRGLKQQMRGHVDAFSNQVQQLQASQQQAQDTLFSFVKIQQELRDIASKDPQVSPNELAQFMLDNHLNDSQTAYELKYGRPAMEKQSAAKAQEMYEQGKKDAEQELANRRVTTETSTGVPWRVRNGGGKSPNAFNSLERKQEIVDRISRELNLPREQAI